MLLSHAFLFGRDFRLGPSRGIELGATEVFGPGAVLKHEAAERENGAEHEVVKNSKTSSEISAGPCPFVEPPAYPKTGNEIFRRLKLSIDQAEGSPGAPLTQKQFAKLLGMPRSTVNDWYHGSLPPPIRYLLCAFERISEPSRLQLLREWCRKCPRLEDPRLAHDAQAVNSLKKLLVRPPGLTIVRGPNELATFVLTALGHSAASLAPHKELRGVDLHEPVLFVPVDGVLYLRSSAVRAEAEPQIDHLLVDLARSPAQLLLFNGLWEAFPSTRSLIIRLAKSRHVITTGAGPKSLGWPATLLALSQAPQNRICIKVEAGGAGERT